MIRVSASLLACNTVSLGEAVMALERAGVDALHLDIMDGHYVENFAFSPKTVQDIRKITPLPLEVHLEIETPERYLETFAEAGADTIIVHLDTVSHPLRVLRAIRRLGKRAGLALNPGEGLERLPYLVDVLDYLLLMSVEPGFGGQEFEASTIGKIRRARRYLQRRGYALPLAVDGGIHLGNVAQVAEAGATVVVVGTGLFSRPDLAEAVTHFRNLGSAR